MRAHLWLAESLVEKTASEIKKKLLLLLKIVSNEALHVCCNTHIYINLFITPDQRTHTHTHNNNNNNYRVVLNNYSQCRHQQLNVYMKWKKTTIFSQSRLKLASQWKKPVISTRRRGKRRRAKEKEAYDARKRLNSTFNSKNAPFNDDYYIARLVDLTWLDSTARTFYTFQA